MSFIKFPLSFEQSQSFRLFMLKAKAWEQTRSQPLVLGSLVAYRIWMEWAMSGVEWRPLRRVVDNPDSHPWKEEELTFIIESFCQWPGIDGELMRAATVSEFIKVENREGKGGLILSDFWKLNEHVSPDFVSMQARGGMARALKLKNAEAITMAEERQKLFESQGILHFGSEMVTQEEKNLSYALLIRLDRACGLAVRPGNGFNETVLKEALRVIRTFTDDQIMTVEHFLIAGRDNHKLVKIPDRIVQEFGRYLEMSQGEK